MALPNTNAAGIDPETMRMLIAQLLAEQGAGGPGMGQGVNTDAGLAGNPSGQWGGSAFGDFNAGAPEAGTVPGSPGLSPSSPGEALGGMITANASMEGAPGPIDSAAPAGYVSTGFNDMGYGSTPAGMVSQGHAAVNDPGPGYGSQGFASQGPTSAASQAQSAITDAMGSLQSPSAFNAPDPSGLPGTMTGPTAGMMNQGYSPGNFEGPGYGFSNPATAPPDVSNFGYTMSENDPGAPAPAPAPAPDITGPTQSPGYTGSPTGPTTGNVATDVGIGIGMGFGGATGDGTSGSTAASDAAGVGTTGNSTGISGGPGGTGEGGANTGEGGGGGGGGGGSK
jgi:hypothetical protein